MKHPVRPGQKCRIISSWSLEIEGRKGPNHHKEVTTVFLHQLQAGEEQAPVWRIKGNSLITSFGVVDDQIDCLNRWLEVIDEIQAPDALTTNTEKEITV